MLDVAEFAENSDPAEFLQPRYGWTTSVRARTGAKGFSHFSNRISRKNPDTENPPQGIFSRRVPKAAHRSNRRRSETRSATTGKEAQFDGGAAEEMV